jgi:group II intron reverse transcriptase/maturase
MVKSWLTEVYFSMPSTVEDYPIGIFVIYRVLTFGALKGEINTCYAGCIIKKKSGQPKDSVRISKSTVGLPKGSNSYGNRVPVVSKRKRGTVKNVSNGRHYSTGRATDTKSNIVDKLESLHNRSKNHPKLPIDREIYKLMSNVDLLSVAYNNLKSKPGMMTPGLNPETLDGISFEVLHEIAAKLRDESFQFKPGRRVSIPKASGGNRQLTIASPRDKIVQEAMRMILEAIFEPTFSEYSHGFRPARSCHTALAAVKHHFQAATWIIEGDISKCFDSIDHNKLMAIIGQKILDVRFTNLIWKSLRAGHFSFNYNHFDIVGTPQGSIISPILANIFMSQLDTMVEEMKEVFDFGEKSPRTKIATSLMGKIRHAKLKGDMVAVRRLSRLAFKHPARDFSSPEFKQLAYLRYADDWIIGVKGSLQDANRILVLVKVKLEEMGLTLNLDKTKITDISSEPALFLGVNIKRSRRYTYARPSHSGILKRNSRHIRFEAPLSRVLNTLKENNFIKSGVSYPKMVWMSLEHREILHRYNAVFRGFQNYYSFTHNFGSLTSLLNHILKQSCAKLLATKFRLQTMAKVYEKFGPQLETTDGEHSFIKPSYKISLKFKKKASPMVKALFGTVSLASLDNLKCSICNSDYRVEMHHIRHMKDLNPKISYLDKLMVKRRRKQIPLCRSCHMGYHRDPKSVNK